MAQRCVVVTEDTQVGEARRVATRLAEAVGFDEATRGRVSVVVTELAQNLSKYGKDGRLYVQHLELSSGPCLEILAVDAGVGMPNVARCLEDGYSTGGTAGTGLGAVRRMSSAFDVYSQPNAGTAIMARIAVSPGHGSTSYDWGAVSTAARGEEVCGDGWRVAERHGHIAVMVTDGLGHGPLAGEASDRATSTFDTDPFMDPSILITKAHAALQGSRGAAVASARWENDQMLAYAGVGNISGSFHGSGRSRGLFTHNGTVGVQMRAAQQQTYDSSDFGVLVMHSDGLNTRWSFDAYPGLIVRHPAVIASVLHRDCLRGRDDATIVVVRSSRHTA
jgi:anti-sigma regulatory factor (Ser/Thr protein kinase)